MIYELGWIAAAGTFGTLARHATTRLLAKLAGPEWLLGTLAVNSIGCFLFGLVWTLAEERMALSAQTRIILLTGFMGSFTTFSTLVFETNVLIQYDKWLHAAGNVLANAAMGFGLLLLGLELGRRLAVET